MKNSEMRPPGSAPLPEAHKAEQEKKDPKESNHVYNERRTHGRGRGGYKGRGGRDNYSYGRGYGNHNNRGRGSNYGRGRAIFGRGRGGISKPTPKHLCELYQESLKNKNPEAHLVHDDGYDADDDFDHEKDDLMDHETSDCLKD
ncbi:zinc finger CCCH domain-containing protein 4-like [Brassica napus]|uniref:zinc finger CCCH domain-containing protein 4-like n=1 Tax=Brassica napus TaxID=3708 RepID=UPI0006AA97DF|nr:zinc finger CCCH domain-containing protein 4-like [Brassica napus]